jgi:CheY-like chemotaxis protein
VAASARPAHVLVADDAPEIRALLREVLEEEGGYRVTLFDAPPEPAEVARLAPDLVVLDHRFGGQGAGAPLRERLGRDPATAAVPVLLCTADHDIGRRLAAAGAPVVLRPFDLDEFLAAVERALRRPPGPPPGTD